MSVHGPPGCITCGDVAVPMLVLEIDSGRGLALCSDADGEPCGAGTAVVETTLVEPVKAGELLLVHAGTALGRAAESAAGRGMLA